MKYRYDQEQRNIYIIKNDNTEELLEELASEPKKYISKIAYIYPFDFETKNDIYIYDFENSKKEKIYNWENRKCPKCLVWKNQNELYVILGETYGTVDVGGDLYLLNINNRIPVLIKKFQKNIQITDVELIGDKLNIKGIEYIDNDMNDNIPYDQIIETVKKSL